MMCCKTLRGVIISYYFAFYAMGATFLSLVTCFFVYGGIIYIYNTDNKPEQMLECLRDALLCYTLTFNIWCQTAVIHCRSKYPIILALSITLSLGMMIGLAAMLIYSTMKLWVFLTFCFIGVGFGVLFLMIVSMLRKKLALKKQKDDCMMMQEEGKNTSGSTSYFKEAEKKEDKL